MDGPVIPSENLLATQERAAEWIARLHADNCTEEDRAEFVQWMRGDTDRAEAVELLTDYWELGGGVQAKGILQTAMVPDVCQSQMRRRVLLVLASVGTAALFPMNRSAKASRVLQTAVGHTLRTPLPDYGTCLLDSGSRMVLSEDGGRARLDQGQVLLLPRTRNAFHLSARNITVHLPEQTSTNIRTDSKCTDITAVRGQVLLRKGAASSKDVWIKTGQRLRIFQNGQISVDYPNIEALLSWQTGRLIFRNTPLPDAISQIQRYTTRQITIASPALENLKLSGVYFVSQGDMFLRMLPRLLPVKLEEHGNLYTLRPL
ncbi:iron transport regulator protein/ sensor kinase [Gluconobacter thailandicus F149-1 = NBRC 100600]|nr:iron transport regulator protein/ sensor kinase [Gluconobacter thailandicus F149-1 = NBRC 100600]